MLNRAPRFLPAVDDAVLAEVQDEAERLLGLLAPPGLDGAIGRAGAHAR